MGLNAPGGCVYVVAAGRRLLLHGDVQTLTFDPPRVGADVWLVKVDLIHFPYEVELI